MLWLWRRWTYIWNYNGIIFSKLLRIFEFCTYMLYAPSTYTAHFCSFCLNLEKMDLSISFNNPVIWKHKLYDSDLRKLLIYYRHSDTPLIASNIENMRRLIMLISPPPCCRLKHNDASSWITVMYFWFVSWLHLALPNIDWTYLALFALTIFLSLFYRLFNIWQQLQLDSN